MKNCYLVYLFISVLLSASLTAQEYRLSDSQKQRLTLLKSNSKLGFGFKQLLKDPSKIDQFIVNKGNISFIASPTNETATLLNELLTIGAKDCVIVNALVCGKISIDAIERLEGLETLKMVMPEFKPKLNVGVVDSEGDRSMLTDSIRNNLGLNGTGIKIGILSDSYNSLGGAADSVLEGDLPGVGNPNGFTKPVVILKDLPEDPEAESPRGSDEGRAMAELIHDVAPGAELFFYTAFDGVLDFAAGIRALEAAGCDIIVDDVSYFVESYFQDSAVGGAVNDVAESGVSYFSSAGNSDRASYENDFVNSGIVGPSGGELLDFGGNDTAQRLTIPAGRSINLFIMWDDPQPAFNDKPNPNPQTDIDAFLFDAESLELLDSSVFDNITDGFNIELIQFDNSTGTTDISADLVIEKFSGPNPRVIKYLDRDEGVVFVDTVGTSAGTCVGHSNVPGAIAVGAASFFNTPEFNDFRVSLGAEPLELSVVNGFSSAGGTPILLASDGTPIEPQFNENPFIVGPNGTNTSFFGQDLQFAPDGFPNFFGTSASAPLVAAATALLLEANNELTTAEIREAYKNTAEDMNDPLTEEFDEGYDVKTGHGFINTFDALVEILGDDFVMDSDIERGESNVISVNAFPSPFEREFKLNLVVEGKCELFVDIFSFTGRNVFHKEITLENRDVNETVYLGNEPDGLYFINVVDLKTQKLIDTRSIFKN
ncbi:S8 family peptidase [Aquimarina agarivorans]|uniref:S8 family peptidase n=1 Tax=Aquimarina agarivorans TaxID=980584 RepID=UPI000248FAFF|nr:S8 family serine peptidase [Aquimarina agarivorans]